MNQTPIAVSRKGGFIWLMAATLIMAMSWYPISTWMTWLINWGIMGVSWVLVNRIKRKISSRETWSSFVVVGILWGLTWLSGLMISRLVNEVAHASPFSVLYSVAISLLIASGIIFWLLAAIVPSEASGIGSMNPSHALINCWRGLCDNKGIWSAALLVSFIQVIAVYADYTTGRWIQVPVGLLTGYSQLYLFHHAGRSRSRSGYHVPVVLSVSNEKTRKIALKAIMILHAALFTFYLVLFISGETHGWQFIIYYPLVWVAGAVYACIAWLIGRIKIVYFLVLFMILMANAIVLGLIVSLFGIEMIV